MATILLEKRSEMLPLILKEIEESTVPFSDLEQMRTAKEAGFVSDKTASEGVGFLPGESLAAEEDHVKRLLRIKVAQTEGDGANAPGDQDQDQLKNPASRGVPDEDPDLDSGKKEKQ